MSPKCQKQVRHVDEDHHSVVINTVRLAASHRYTFCEAHVESAHEREHQCGNAVHHCCVKLLPCHG